MALSREEAQALLGKKVTVWSTRTDPFTKKPWTGETTGKVEKVEERTMTLRQPPIRGLSSNVTAVVSYAAIVRVEEK